jgi:hypothetical protein
VVVADGAARGRSHLTNTLVANGGWLIDVQLDFKSWGVAGGRMGKRRMPLWRNSTFIKTERSFRQSSSSYNNANPITFGTERPESLIT